MRWPSNSNFDIFVRSHPHPQGRGPPCAVRLSGVVRDLDVLPEARRGGGRLQDAQGRPGDTPGLPSTDGPRRGPYPRRVRRLLPPRDAQGAARRTRAGADAPQRAGETRRDPDARRPLPDHRRPRARVRQIHRAGAGPAARHRRAGLGSAAPAAAEDHRLRNARKGLVATDF